MGERANILSVATEIRRTGSGVLYQTDHAHHQLEFNLIISGKGTYFLEDGQHDLVPGTLVWLLPGQPHRLIRSPDLDMWVALISPEELDEELVREVAEQPCRVLASADAIALDRLLAHISQDSDEPTLYRTGLEYAFRSAWRASRLTNGAPQRAMHPAVIRTLEILRSSAETPSATALAKMCGISQDYLGQLLVEHTGRGFVEWRNRTRLERFHILYPQSGDLLTAAFDAGFGSYTQFHRVFCEMVGTTPGEWARNGAAVQTVALPSEARTIKGSDAESTRMIWYPLAEISLQAAARWLSPSFGAHLPHKGPLPHSTIPVESGVESYADLRRFEPILLDEIRAIDADRCAKLERAFSRNDLFETYRSSIGQYELGVQDLANLVGLYMMFAWIAANHAPIPSISQLLRITGAARHSIAAAGCFDAATVEERQLAAAALIVQIMMLRGAVTASRAGGGDVAVKRIAQAACNTARATLGVDIAALRLAE